MRTVKEIRQWNEEMTGGKLVYKTRGILLADLLEKFSSRIYCTKEEYLMLVKQNVPELKYSNNIYILEAGELHKIVSLYEGMKECLKNTVSTSPKAQILLKKLLKNEGYKNIYYTIEEGKNLEKSLYTVICQSIGAVDNEKKSYMVPKKYIA